MTNSQLIKNAKIRTQNELYVKHFLRLHVNDLICQLKMIQLQQWLFLNVYDLKRQIRSDTTINQLTLPKKLQQIDSFSQTIQILHTFKNLIFQKNKLSSITVPLYLQKPLKTHLPP